MAQQASFQAIGTLWDIQVDDDIDDEAWSQVMAQVHDRIDAFDGIYSRFRPDSMVSRMAEQGGRHQLPPDGHKLLQFYERLYRATNGMVTPLIGQAMADAGYDAAYSFRERPLQVSPAWEEVISYDEHVISLAEPALLDFGAAGKGYLVDIVAALLIMHGLASFTINAGGDVLHRSDTGIP
ncbi:MAG TPA: FAD:protein FMN transferase, partial [Candidatus Saccharimonadales bacterium]|nr:FAD:protein FMN transferase [Candidatus Saccharimonadales bacterium]